MKNLSLSVALCSSRGSVSVHQWKDSNCQVVKEQALEDGFKHSEQLLSAVDNCLSNHSIKEVSAILTTRGPGSFTGLRIAFATLKALAFTQKTPIETFDGAEIRALDFLHSSKKSWECIVVLTGAPTRFTASVFKRTENGVELLSTQTCTNSDEIPEADIVIENAPVKASLLAKYRYLASSREIHSESEQWIPLSPEYFGSAQFRTVKSPA